jgi:hypothetical protein
MIQQCRLQLSDVHERSQPKENTAGKKLSARKELVKKASAAEKPTEASFAVRYGYAPPPPQRQPAAAAGSGWMDGSSDGRTR